MDDFTIGGCSIVRPACWFRSTKPLSFGVQGFVLSGPRILVRHEQQPTRALEAIVGSREFYGHYAE